MNGPGAENARRGGAFAHFQQGFQPRWVSKKVGLYNPYVKTNKNGKIIISPEKGKKYADRKQSFPYKIDKNDLCYKEFIKHGFIWGGAWKSLKDYQHFEKVRQ